MVFLDRLRCGHRARGVDAEGGEDGDDRAAVDGDVPALPVPVLGGDVVGLGQLVQGRFQLSHWPIQADLSDSQRVIAL
jgi:hypothetical protein